jgi:hypothetical protein
VGRQDEIVALWEAAAATMGRLARTGDAGSPEAWDLIFGAMSYLCGSGRIPRPFPGAEITPRTLAEARAALFGGERASADRELLTHIQGARRAAQAGWLTFSAAAQRLATLSLRGDEIDVQELARRLENHYVPKKKGRPPRGMYSDAQIVEYLTGEKNARKRATKAQKKSA